MESRSEIQTFDVSGNVPLVSVTPTSGASVGPLDRVLVTVAVDATGLPAGRHQAMLQISGTGFRGPPQRVEVVVTVTSAAFAGALAPQYDVNNNLTIEFGEVLAAVKDYFDDRITLEASWRSSRSTLPVDPTGVGKRR